MNIAKGRLRPGIGAQFTTLPRLPLINEAGQRLRPPAARTENWRRALPNSSSEAHRHLIDRLMEHSSFAAREMDA